MEFKTETNNSQPAPKREPETRDRQISQLGWLALWTVIIGVIVILIYDTTLSGKATILIWIFACLVIGAFIGFLFGIPKILQKQNAQNNQSVNDELKYQQQVNTNLTEISDWLTKIIVGLGLVNLTKIPPQLTSLAKLLSASLSTNYSGTSAATAFGYGIIIGYSIMGFLYGYITTRLYLAVAFAKADQNAINSVKQDINDAKGAAQSALQKVEFAIAKPATEISQSLDVNSQLEDLMNFYNVTRRDIPSGDLRTKKMTEIFKAMINLLVELPNYDISQALKSKDNGKRLSGYAFLYNKPDYSYLSQLVDAFSKDPTPFGQYWGILTLGKLLEVKTENKVDTDTMSKIRSFYNGLKKGIDREYELAKILPELRIN
jgi:hypothetical protein